MTQAQFAALTPADRVRISWSGEIVTVVRVYGDYADVRGRRGNVFSVVADLLRPDTETPPLFEEDGA